MLTYLTCASVQNFLEILKNKSLFQISNFRLNIFLYGGGLSGKSLILRVLKNQVLYSRRFQMYLKLTNGERKIQLDST